MRNYIYFFTLLIVSILVLFNLYGCSTFEIVKEGAKAIKIVATANKTDKKLKEKETTDEEKEKENTIACIKLQPECESE